jgi:hypothetical protein
MVHAVRGHTAARNQRFEACTEHKEGKGVKREGTSRPAPQTQKACG